MIAALNASPFVTAAPVSAIAPVIFHPVSAPVTIAPAPVSPALPVAPLSVPASASATSSPAPAQNQISPAASSSASSSSSSSSTAPAAPLAQYVSGIVDPVTNITYSGYLTTDAQTLYQSGSLVTNGNALTPQGSALAAQGDLITGTPAPTAAQVAAASPAAASATSTTDFWTAFTNWLSAETLFAGVPNGAIAAGGLIVGAMLFGGGKKRR